MSPRLTVIVPAAGAGRRLRPLTERLPKPLVPLAGATLLDHALSPLEGAPYDEVVFVVPPGDGAIEAHVAANGPARARFVVQPDALGQADAVARACDGVAGPVLVLFPDTVHDVDLGALARAGGAPGAPDGVLHLRPVDRPERFGVAVVEGGVVVRLVEKPAAFVSNLAVVGVYWLADAAALAAACRAAGAHTDGEVYLAAALQRLIDGGARLEAAPVTTWLDCGTLPDLLASNGILLESGGGWLRTRRAASVAAVGAGTTVQPPAWVAATAAIEDSAIGPGVSVGAGARIVRSTVGPRVHVGAGAVIEDARVADAIVCDSAALIGATIEGRIVAQGGVLGEAGALEMAR